MGILAFWVRWKETENADTPIEGQCTDPFTHRHIPWAPAEGQPLRRCKNWTEKD